MRKNFHQHHPDRLDALRHLDAGEFFQRQHIGQIVHDPTEIIDAVGIGNIAVPGLTLAHLLGATVVVADVRDAVDHLFAIQLQHDTKGAVGRGVVGTQIEEHEIVIVGAAFHPPILGDEAQRLLLHILTQGIEMKGIKFGGARRIILAQRVAGPGGRQQDAAQTRVAFEADTEQIPDFALVPVGVRIDTGDGRQRREIAAQRDLDADVALPARGDVARHRQQVIDDGEIRRRQAVAVLAQTLVDRGQVVQHRVGLRHPGAQQAHHLGNARHRVPTESEPDRHCARP